MNPAILTRRSGTDALRGDLRASKQPLGPIPYPDRRFTAPIGGGR